MIANFLAFIFFVLFVVFLVLYLTMSKTGEHVTVSALKEQNTEGTSDQASDQAYKLDDTAPSEKSRGIVTVHLQGGLGNQLFQIAAAYAYAKDTEKTLALDHSLKFVRNRKTYFDTVYNWTGHLPKMMKQRNWLVHTEPHFHFSKIPERFGNVSLKGYYQSIKYFEKYRGEIVELFRAHTKPIDADNQLLATIRALNEPSEEKYPDPDEVTATVSLHIRRSDYVGSSMHPVQPMSYYKEALEKIRIRTEIKSLTLFVFSDDIAWCKQHLAQELRSDDNSDEIYFVDSPNLVDEQELLLMAECKHHIIANSSFSWWGAVYDTRSLRGEESIVVAPAKWFNDTSYNWQDIYCEGWIVI